MASVTPVAAAAETESGDDDDDADVTALTVSLSRPPCYERSCTNAPQHTGGCIFVRVKNRIKF